MKPIEKAARAFQRQANLAMLGFDDGWDNNADHIQDDYRKAVRGVLAAIMEPSEEMLAAGKSGCRVFLLRPHEVQDIWQAMLRALLDETTA